MDHPTAPDAPEPYGTSYRVLSVRELTSMLPYAQGARLAAIVANLRVRGVNQVVQVPVCKT